MPIFMKECQADTYTFFNVNIKMITIFFFNTKYQAKTDFKISCDYQF